MLMVIGFLDLQKLFSLWVKQSQLLWQKSFRAASIHRSYLQIYQSETMEILWPSQIWKQFWVDGSGFGSVGRVVASNSRGLWFEFSHQKKFYWAFYCQLYWKDENKEKEGGNGHSKTLLSRPDRLSSHIRFLLRIKTV